MLTAKLMMQLANMEENCDNFETVESFLEDCSEIKEVSENDKNCSSFEKVTIRSESIED